MKFVRQWAQCFAKKCKFSAEHRELALLGYKLLANDANKIAEVYIVEQEFKNFLTKHLKLEADLNLASNILNVSKSNLAVLAKSHDATGHRHGFAGRSKNLFAWARSFLLR